MTLTDDVPTRGGYALPPPSGGDRRFVGPADDPDRYELLGEGITGGEGTTWRARYHGSLPRPLPLAVKRLHSPGRTRPGWPSTEDRRRWQDQAALLRHLRLDHVVRLYEIFSGPPPEEYVHLVMEWLDGPTLSELCRDEPATKDSLRPRLTYVAQAAAALTELSSSTRTAGNPSLHRDVKPGNCIITPDRGLVLIDVSTLRLIDDGVDPSGMHTPEYTAPEVLAAPHLPRTPATDVYSLGALAAYCLTGRDPAPTGTAPEDLVTIVSAAGVARPEALVAHIMTTLDPDPRRRPDDPAAWGRQLTALGLPKPSRARGVLVGAGTAVLLAGSFLVLHDRDGPSTATPTPAASGAVGQIVTPADGARVEQCSYFEGTSAVPPGVTLILAMRNIVNGDPEEYVQVVYGYNAPARLPAWRGAQYFGDGNETVGQTYRVRLVAVPTAAALAWRTGDGNDPGTALAAGGQVLDEVTLHRVTGLGADGCHGD